MWISMTIHRNGTRVVVPILGGLIVGGVGWRSAYWRRRVSSGRVRRRQVPMGRVPMEMSPMRTRTSFITRAPMASTMRRTWRLRPSVSVISKWVCLPESLSFVTLAGRVGPSLSSTPLRSWSSWSSVKSSLALTR